MDADFKKQIEYCKIPLWRDKGYTGEGIAVFMDDVGGNHAECTKMVVETILPEARVLSGSIGVNYNSTTVTNATISCTETKENMLFEDFITKYNVRLINNSTTGGDHNKNSTKAVWLREMRDKYNLILTASAGNGYGSPIDNSFYGAAIVVTGVNSNKRSTYAEDKDIDFTAYTAGMSGTSFAAPFLCGMAGSLLCKYPNWTQTDIYKYLQEHAEDLGKADIYGRGLALMGNPVTKIVMPIGSNTMTVDGREVALDQPAEINKKTKRTLVPVRAISEALGAEVNWNNKTRSVEIEL